MADSKVAEAPVMPLANPNAEGPTEANKSWVNSINDAIGWIRAAGVSGTARAALDEASKSVKAAKESNFTKASLEKLNSTWMSVINNPSVQSTLKSSGSLYARAHDTVVNDERYAKVVDGSASVISGLASVAGSAFSSVSQTEAYKSASKAASDTFGSSYQWAAEKVGPAAATARDAVAPHVAAAAKHLAPVRNQQTPADTVDAAGPSAATESEQTDASHIPHSSQ